jgi:ribosomal-protein-alanine N-acetyltransferase
MTTTTIHTDRLRLRQWRDADLEPFAALSSDPEVMRFYRSPLTRAQSDAFAARCRDHIDAFGYGPWAVEVAGGPPFIGVVGLSRPDFRDLHTPLVNVSWRLVRTAWGRGYATEAARAAIAFAFGVLQLDEVCAVVAHANGASRRVMQRLGMTHDPSEDFDHPFFADDHPTRRHALYRLRASGLLAA